MTKAGHINNYSSSEIRENQSSLNTEGNNTLYHTSKVESEANGNLEQDVLSLIKSISKEEENFLVYYQLCVSEALLAVRRYFSRKVPESTLAAHLENYTNDLKFSRWKCTHDQLNLLFPAVPGNVCSTSFDFSLLYKLIRNTLSLLSSPTRGWGIKPLKGDITDLDDIERIRHNRTLLANNTKLKLTNSDFKYLVNDLSQAIKRLSFETLTIDKCRSKKKLYLQRHKEISENIRKDIENLKDEINTLHRDMFEGKYSILNLQERLKKADQHNAFHRHTLAPYVAILKEHHTFDIPPGAKKRKLEIVQLYQEVVGLYLIVTIQSCS
ncbi:unnamed protein product [Mytilus edulis]|uniref:DZIP3-like HEPN domain-containing protein n=1 Tax=Mytilus edulis TaxID=6550 RepID=A0A8S3Q9J8_MYTED|nr:unnamed protein product [Mytilus edulis]